MDDSFADLFLKPNAFFQDLMTRKESLRLPALIILAAGIITAANAYLVVGLTAKMMAGIMPGLETIIMLSAIIGSLFFTFIVWIVWAGVFYALSFVFKGKGSFKRTLEIVGYGYLPQIFGTLITFIVAFLYIPGMKIPTLTAAGIQDPQLMHDPAMMAFTQITSVVSIFFLLLSANIWIFGLKHARAISLRDGAICVGVPVVGYILYVIYTLIVM
jgi:hypothetical protein